MAFNLDNLLESVVPAVISGGGTAISTILAFFRDIKKKVEDVEKKVGSFESKSGLVWALHTLEETVKKLKEEAEKREQEPPPIVVRGGRSRSGSFTNELIPWEDIRGEIHELVKRELNHRFQDLDERLNKIDQKLKKAVTEDDFENADRARADEIAEVKETMAEIRGLLMGLQSALGLIKGPTHR